MILSMPFLKSMPTPLAVDLDLAKTQVEAKIAAEGAASSTAGVFVSYPGSPFELFQPYQPAGDQPTAINELVDGINDGEVFQTLLGVTGSGKTFTMANVIARMGRPAIIFAPTLVAGIYGMNFDVMPELQWTFGYPVAIGLMLGFAGTLYVIFKKRNWL
jgi:hypothetical protein